MDDLISRYEAIEALARMMPMSYTPDGSHPADEEIFKAQEIYVDCIETLKNLPSAQPEYEPVTAEDFAKTMSENTLYSFMTWHGEALELMERQGFVICKKTM